MERFAGRRAIVTVAGRGIGVALCDCPADLTGRSFVSLDLLAQWDIEVRGLDRGPLP